MLYLLYDCGDVSEYGRVEQRGHDHHADGEYLLVVRLRGDVAEAHAGHARHGVVQRRHVHGLAARAVLHHHADHGRVVDRT